MGPFAKAHSLRQQSCLRSSQTRAYRLVLFLRIGVADAFVACSMAMAGPNLIDNEKRAQQKARAIASDIYLYNKAKIEEALQHDTFFDDPDLSELITEGRDLFRSGVTPEMFKKNFYDRAIVDRVIKPMAALKSGIW
jgi:hypothetical protein